MLLQINSNSKLGKVGAVSLPAMKTCPGKTEYCEKVCYANKHMFKFPNVIKSLENNYEIAKSPEFAIQLTAAVNKTKTNIVRIHPAGDFFSREYLQQWISVVRATPNTKYWVYTRSWRVPEMISDLKELNELPNIQVFASIDNTTTESPPPWMRKAVIVKTWDGIDSSYVQCPAQKNKAITCEKCTYCFKSSKGNKINVAFKEH